MSNLNRWYKNYIENINLKNLEWINLNAAELRYFLENNYLDREIWNYVCDENGLLLHQTLFGMSYLNFDNPLNDKECNFLLGIVDNNIGKKTVIAATIYLDKYFMFNNQEKPVTYISTMEVNSYFRNKGIYKKMCEVLINYININQNILTTRQSEMGVKFNAFNILKDTLLTNGFKNYIFEDNRKLMKQELYDTFYSKSK